MCLGKKTFQPEPDAVAVYEKLFKHYRDVYFALGTRDAAAAKLGDVLPDLKKIATEAEAAK